MYKQMCTCSPHYFNSVTGICFACGAQGVPIQALRPIANQSNCQHGHLYFDVAHNLCLVCGVPGVPVPQQGHPAGGGPYHIAPPVPVPAPSPNLLQHVFTAIRAGFKPLEPLSETPPKPTEEELLKRANDAFPVLTAKELLCHRCCTIMRPRITFSINFDCLVAEVTCHGVTERIGLIEGETNKPWFREAVVGMLQDVQGKNRDD